MRSYVKKVENNNHLLYEEMVDASKYIFDEQTDSQEIIDFLLALLPKGRRHRKSLLLQEL